MFKRLNIPPWFAVALFCGCQSVQVDNNVRFSKFIGLDDFSNFQHSQNAQGETVLLSPEIKPVMAWNELVVSWNANAPSGTYLTIEAHVLLPDHVTKFYTLGRWSPDNRAFPRTSVPGQKDPDGNVKTDTLILNNLAGAAQIRVTLGGPNSETPDLKFLGLSFCNTGAHPPARPPNRAAWGTVIPVPERSQLAYPQQKGWCSPTAVSMVLSRWSEVLHRPELNVDVPEVAARVYDDAFAGTGNWPFNTAFAGGFPGLRSYV
ncbi:MAG: C39 family peptidase, partial [Verrucomicrobiota bacterium]